MAPSSVEHPIKIRGDNNDPSFTKGVWTSFFIANAVIFISAVLIPDSRIATGAKTIECHKDIYDRLEYKCHPFHIESNPYFAVEISQMSEFNQFAVLEAFPIKKKNAPKVSSTSMSLETSIYSVDASNKISSTIIERSSKNLIITCHAEEETHCDPLELASIPQLSDQKYVMVLRITNAPVLKDSSIEDLKLALISANPSYSTFYICFRYIITFIAIVSFIRYHISLSKYEKRHHSKEQNQLWWIGLQMVFFNDPLFYVTFTKRGLVPSILAMFPMISFATLLMHFWILSFDRIALGTKSSKNTNWLSWLYVGLFYVSGLACYGFLTYETADHPLLHFYNNDSFEFTYAKSLFKPILAVGVVWIVYRMSQILSKKSSLSNRDNIFFLISIFFAVIHTCFIWTGALEIYHDNPIRQVLLFGLTNIYTYFMLYLYTPTGEGNLELVRLPVAQSDSFRATEESSFDEKDKNKETSSNIHEPNESAEQNSDEEQQDEDDEEEDDDKRSHDEEAYED